MPRTEERGIAVLPRSRFNRAVGLAILTVVGVLTMGARCVENVTVHTDADGFTHISGEMFNDTDSQAVEMVVRGRLLDGQGNVIAEKDARICPPDISPHSQAVFDIEFDQPGLRQHASFDVYPVSGRAIDPPLPDPSILVLSRTANRAGDDVLFVWKMRNRSDTAYAALQGCAAAYNNVGEVVAAESSPFVFLDEEGEPAPEAGFYFEGPVFFWWVMEDVPSEARQVRGWVWIGEETSSTSDYRFLMTPKITIQADIGPLEEP